MDQQRNQQRIKPPHALLLAVILSAWPAFGEDVTTEWLNDVRLASLIQLTALHSNLSSYCTMNCGYDAGFSQGRGDWRSDLTITQDNSTLHLGLEARKDLVQDHASFVDAGENYLSRQFALPSGRLTVTVGRQILVWGESQLFADNAIAGAMAPIDGSNGRSGGLYDNSGHFLPLAQIVARWQWHPSWTVMAYQQAEWRRNRSDPNDPNNDGGEILGAEANDQIRFTPRQGPAFVFQRSPSATPQGRDQFGLALRGQLGVVDVGLYALRFDAKSPNLAYDIQTGLYRLNYATGIELVGVSGAAPLGDTNLTVELSGRHRQPLVNTGSFKGNDTSLGPRGDVLQGQLGLSGTLAPRSLWPGGGAWVIELAGNHLADLTDDGGGLAAGRSQSAAALRGQLTAQYFQLWPGIDLSLPVTLGYGLFGRSAVVAAMNSGDGNVGITPTLTIDQLWSVSFNVTHYFGKYLVPLAPQPVQAPDLSRWDEVGVSLQIKF